MPVSPCLVRPVRAAACALLVLALAPPAARPQPQSEAPAETVEAARELLGLMSKDMVAQLAANVTAQMWPSIEPRLRAFNRNVDETALAALRGELERIQLDHMMNIVKDGPAIYARHFTAAELREIIGFYRTPTGTKLLRLSPQLSAEVNASITPHLPDFYRRSMEAFTKVLRSRGYSL
jgi:hypothetical protein